MLSRRNALLVLSALVVVVAIIIWRRQDKRTTSGNDERATASAKEGSSREVSSADTTAGEVTRTASISGRVTDAKGPVAGASVCAWASSERLVSADTKTPRCVQTGADGRYTLRGLPAARYELNASAPSYQPVRYRDAKRSAELGLKAGEARDAIDFVLERGGVEVRGLVKDLSGGVVVGAMVSVTSGPEEWSPIATSFTTTNAQGEFSAWMQPGRLHATATAIGYTKGKKEGIAPGQRIEIMITPESVLQGRVVEAGTDTPVPGARVVSGAITSMPWASESDSALTDADGRFRIAGIEPGRYHPTATIAHKWGTTSESVLLGLAETSRELVIELHASPSLVGRIEFENKEPCLGSVSLKATGTQERRWVESDSEGRIRVEGLLPGKYSVSVWCDHGAAQDKYEPVTMGDKDVSVVWRVETGHTLTGIVVDAEGAPVAGASVQGRTRGGDPRAQMGWKSAQTETDGTFKMRGLLSATYGLGVVREGATPLEDPIDVEVKHDVANVRITLPAGGGIEGKVVDSSGAPVPGVDVWAKGDRWDWESGRTNTKDDGSFSFPALRPGTYHVEAQYRWSAVRAPGTKDDDVQGVSATVTVGKTAQVKIVVESQNERIQGDVVDENGVALSDAFVEAEREPDRAGAAAGAARRSMEWSWGMTVRSPVLTDLDGHFAVTKLSPGSYTVRAFRKGGGESVSEGVKTGTSVTLKIKKEGSISGTLKDAKGVVPQRFTVSVRDEKTGVHRSESFVRTGGTWTLRDLPPGDFVVGARGVGSAQTRVQLAQGEERKDVALLLNPNTQARGRIVSLESGQPIAGMMVFARAKGTESGMIFGDDDESGHKNVTDADGRFELSTAPVGRTIITAFPKDFEADGAPGFIQIAATLNADTMNELPPIRAARTRVRGALTGDLGFNTADNAPGTDPDEYKQVVSVVRPDGPAARAKLAVGDEILSIDGHDVAGSNTYLYWTLSRVAEGTTVKLGLKRGAEVAITAAAPRAGK